MPRALNLLETRLLSSTAMRPFNPSPWETWEVWLGIRSPSLTAGSMGDASNLLSGTHGTSAFCHSLILGIWGNNFIMSFWKIVKQFFPTPDHRVFYWPMVQPHLNRVLVGFDCFAFFLSLGYLAYSAFCCSFKPILQAAAEVVQGLKKFAPKPDNLYLIPRAHRVEQEKCLLKVVLCVHTCIQ